MKDDASNQLFEYRSVEKRKLLLSLSITTAVMVVELIGGILAGSIALISDAGHMFTHAFAITISLLAILVSQRPVCHHTTFGLFRSEILAAFVNGLFLLIVVGVIVFEAIQRILHPKEILGIHMLLIALIGLAVNVASIWILHGSHENDLNVRSVFYHMIADAASSIGIVIAAVIILYTGWNILDPLVCLGISALILYWAWGILRESGRILLEMAPREMNIDIISDDLKSHFPQIAEITNTHLWTITGEMVVFTAHFLMDGKRGGVEDQNALIASIQSHLSNQYGIEDSTLQIIYKERRR